MMGGIDFHGILDIIKTDGVPLVFTAMGLALFWRWAYAKVNDAADKKDVKPTPTVVIPREEDAEPPPPEEKVKPFTKLPVPPVVEQPIPVWENRPPSEIRNCPTGCRLHQHRVFHLIRSVIDTKLPKIEMECELRREISKAFLKIKFEVFEEELRKFLDAHALCQLTGYQLYAELNEHFSEIVIAYEAKARADAIPTEFIDAYNERIQHTMLFVEETIGHITSDPFLRTGCEKTAAYFDVVTGILAMTALDVKRTLGTLNGELDDVTYKGYRAKKSKGKAHG